MRKKDLERHKSDQATWLSTIRDNFWMMMALIYSGHEAEANPVVMASNELEYLFDDTDMHGDSHHVDIDVNHHIDFDYDHHPDLDYFDHHHGDFDHHSSDFGYDDHHHSDFGYDDLDIHH